MTNKPHLSVVAEADLDDIWLYIAQDRVKAADRLISRIHRTCHLLARTPDIGRRRDELGPSLRSFLCGNYVIFYRLIPKGVEVVRVLHGHRDIDTIFQRE